MNLGKCATYVRKKMGQDYAEEIFVDIQDGYGRADKEIQIAPRGEESRCFVEKG